MWIVCGESAVPAALVARTVKVYEPAAVGVPDNTPADESVRPVGSDPELEKETPPPDATNVYVNGVPVGKVTGGEFVVKAGAPRTTAVEFEFTEAEAVPLSAVSRYIRR
jgi:hypothetical protein